MIRPPFAARVALGLAVTVVEEARRLPTTAISLPMTAISQVLQTSMRFQQSVTELAIKGDQVFSLLGGPPEEKASWATFDDDDVVVATPRATSVQRAAATVYDDIDVPDPDAPPVGHFALYSTPPSALEDSVTPKTSPKAVRKSRKTPEIAEYLDYDALTLAQLRARLRTLSVEDLSTLLDYENAAAQRAPFQTMLANRITTARAK